MEISRRELYEQVWTKPLRKLAGQFGVSDVALAKACRRHAVPRPPMGHWTRVEHGKGVARPPLPPAPFGDIVRFSEEQSRAQKAAKQTPTLPGVAVEVRVETDKSAPFAAATLTTLRKSKPNHAGVVSTGGAAHFECVVSCGSIDRAARILDAVERGLTQIGAKVVRGADGKPLTIDVDGQAVRFTLTERHTRTEFIPESQRNSPYPSKEYQYHCTGELKVAMEGYFAGRKNWTDGARARLEDKLPEVLTGLAAGAAALRKRALEQEEQQRR
jgi:hypothetical protein